MIRTKICCISSIQEANLAIFYGASAIGLVGKMPSGPGVIQDSTIKKITQHTPPGISSFLLTSETDSQKIIDHQKRVNSTTIQLVDELKSGSYAEIRAALPDIKLVQVIHVIDEHSVDEAIRISKFVDAILLDSGNPKSKILGGTGKTHNWELSKKIRESIDIPLFLAGGICADNVEEAVKIVKPFGVDLCSSVRTNNKLDENKLKLFFEAMNKINGAIK